MAPSGCSSLAMGLSHAIPPAPSLGGRLFVPHSDALEGPRFPSSSIQGALSPIRGMRLEKVVVNSHWSQDILGS